MTSFYREKSREEIRDDICAAVRNTMDRHGKPVRADGPGDDIFDIAAGMSGPLHESRTHTAELADEAFPQTAGVGDPSFESLVEHARRHIGDPHPATPATGLAEGTGAFKCTGLAASAWSSGDTFVHRATSQRYETTSAGSIAVGQTSAFVPVRALTAGDAGALVDGETVLWESPPVGVDATAIVDGDMEGGTEAETREEYLARYLDYVRNPSAGGTAKDFEQWALSVTGVGIAAAFPNRRELGTCDVAVLDPEGDPVSAAVLADVQDKLDEERPCTSLGSMAVHPVLTDVDLTFEIVLDAAYGWTDAPATTVGADATRTVIPVAAAAGWTAGMWAAVRRLRQAREVQSVDLVGNEITVAQPYSEAPTLGDDLVPGSPTYDALADAVEDLFYALKPGGTYYKDAGESAIRTNPEVISVTQTSPAGNVTAAVDATKVEALRLGELTMQTP